MAARRTANPLPKTAALQLCTLVDQPFDDAGWIFEPKLDGLRVLARVEDGNIQLVSRNGKRQDGAFPDVVEGLRKALRGPALLDGEIVCLDEKGRSSFRLLQQRFHLEDHREIERRAAAYPAYLYVFDALHAGGGDLRDEPLEVRRRILDRTIRWNDRVRRVEAVEGRGRALFNQMCRRGGEGIIAKRRDSPYRGGRSADWLKIKCSQRQEFVIGGYTDPQRSRVGIGALLVGYYEDDGQTLRYAGKVGTGFTTEVLRDLRARLERIERRTSPFQPGEGPRGGVGGAVHWVRPELVAEIAFGEWTQHGMLRQPRFEGLRMDKKPTQVRRERAGPAKQTARQAEGHARSRSKRTPAAARTPGRGAGGTLARYNEKRDFTRTPEPAGKRQRKAPKDQGPRFVVQKHAASRLHFDLRLEADGVLKSWAVPKTPTLDPGVKRLAVEVEDHPLQYGEFEGEIPEGQYGAGTVEIWDSGTYTRLKNHRPVEGDIGEDMAAGKIEVEFHGKRLKGAFALVRTRGRRGQPNWLLIKLKDRHAKPGSAAADEQHEAERRPRRRNGRSSSSNRTRSGRVRTSAAAKVPETPDPPSVEDLEFTNLDKVMFPEAGITKGDLIDYYRKAAARLLPHIKDRPVSVERMPDGIGGVRFWQKNTPASYPAWIPRVELPTEDGRTVRYALINSEQALLYFINQGTISLHTGFSRIGSLERPDFVLFDLDPGEALFADVVRVALALRPLIEQRGGAPSVKTSGKSGLHVIVPWTGKGGFDEARAWARQIAEELVEREPDLATLERSKKGRRGNVYVDVQQNALGLHAVPPWVVRATPRATVSTPLAWPEVNPRLDPGRFTVRTVLRRKVGEAK